MSTTLRPPPAWTHPLQRGMPPAWASGWGEDERYGPWCAFEVGDVVQRLRWIPPGVFWMGSPEDEEGRISYEGPRHLVSIDSGFWMFDTPCTQALWESVMGENPSHFKGPAALPQEGAKRPVETVSWEQCQTTSWASAVPSSGPGRELRETEGSTGLRQSHYATRREARGIVNGCSDVLRFERRVTVQDLCLGETLGQIIEDHGHHDPRTGNANFAVTKPACCPKAAVFEPCRPRVPGRWLVARPRRWYNL
jgi:hypothetical protein